jgi:hypothetical protein
LKTHLFFGWLVVAAMLAGEAKAYDDSWYRTDWWGREQPSGFTVTQDATIYIRGKIDRDAPRDLRCDLGKGGTYHPWNETRRKEAGLEFVTMTKIEHYVVRDDSEQIATRYPGDGPEIVLKFKAGERWDDVAYGAEGYFLMRYNGELFFTFQDMRDGSESQEKFPEPYAARHQEWLKLSCENDANGWLFLDDLDGNPAFVTPLPDAAGRVTDVAE